MSRESKTDQKSRPKITELRARLEEAEETLRALRNGELDAVVVGEQLYLLESAEAASNRLRGDALALVHDAVIAVNNEGRVTYLNPAAEQQYGVAASEALGRALTEVYQTRWLRPEDEIAFAALPKQGYWRGENIHVKRNGEPLHVDSSVCVLRDYSGTATGLLAIIRDSSERKSAELALQRSEANLRDFLENASVGMHWVDTNGIIIWANRAELEMLGYEREEYVGRHIAEFHVDQNVVADILNRLQCGETLQNHEARLRHKNGSIRYGVINSNVLWEDGKFVHTRCFTRDITERKEAEASRAQLSAIVESSADAIYSYDFDGRILTWNKSAEDLYGYAAAEIIGQNITVLPPLAQEHEPANIIAAIKKGEPVISFETERQRKDGSYFVALMTASPIKDAAGQPVALSIIVRDITTRKKAEAERERLLAQEQRARSTAEAATRAKDEFLAMISHELRNPLNAILGYTRMARNQAHDPAAVVRHCEIVERSARMQQQLIEDLLDTARIISGKLKIEAGATDLRLVLEEALSVVVPAATAKQIRLVTRLGDEPLLVIGDAARLQQVVWNLLQNAIKFTPNGGRVELWLEREQEQVRIVVSDSGQGIESEFLEAIFDRFSQRDMARTRRHGGLGLGLALVKDLVELHGGKISVSSAGAGEGAIFTVTLPLRAPQIATYAAPRRAIAEVRTDPEAMPLDELPRLDDVRILVIDDQEEARELVAATLSEWGARVMTAASGAKARVLLAEQSFDAVVCDIAMPEEDGYTVIRHIRALEHERGVPPLQRLPAVALTALARPEDRWQALNAGFQMHVAKPVELAELVLVISTLTRNDTMAWR